MSGAGYAKGTTKRDAAENALIAAVLAGAIPNDDETRRLLPSEKLALLDSLLASKGADQ